jgi:hypothetical protein
MNRPKNNHLAIRWELWRLALVGLMVMGCAVKSGTTQPLAADPAISPDDISVEMMPLRFDHLLPASPQPDPEAMRPGLQVVYFYEFFKRNVHNLPKDGLAKLLGKPGKPILSVNHQFADGPVFDSGKKRGVGMRMNGMIHLSEIGEYMFRILSNDGILFYLGGQLIVEDPDVHSDRWSVPAVVSVHQTGWYPLLAEYFQRKGTAALRFYWRPPGADTFAPIPASAYAHQPAVQQ